MRIAHCLYLLFVFNSVCPEFSFVSNKTEDGSLSAIFMKEFIEIFHPDIFIETGTYSGVTSFNMAPLFKHVHTVELSYDLYTTSQRKLKACSNVTTYHGSSAQTLETIIPQCKGTLLFWLDAHYSGGNTVFSNSNPDNANAVTAIREELEIIAKARLTDCLILIDDMRGFGSVIGKTEFLGCWAYPSIQEVCALGYTINKNFEFILLGDSLLMYDKTKYSPNLSPVVKACTISRLYDGSNFSEEQLVEAEHTIMHSCTEEERIFIKNLYDIMTNWKDPLFHHDLWYALISMGCGNWHEAQAALNKVPERVEYLNKHRQSVAHIVRYNPSRFQHYFEVIEKNI